MERRDHSKIGFRKTILLLLLLTPWIFPIGVPDLQFPRVAANGFTTLGVWSEAYKTRSAIDTNLVPNESIVVGLNVTGLHSAHFTSYDLTIRYNPNVLNVTDIDVTQGLFNPAEANVCPSSVIDKVNGLARQACSRSTALTDVEAGVLFTIQFGIIAVGNSFIDIDELVSRLDDEVSYVSLDGFFSNQAETRNVAVSSVSTDAPDDIAIRGSTVKVDVALVNQGTDSEFVTVSVYHNGTEVGMEQTMSVPGLHSATFTFSWDTTAVGLGVYNVTAVATTLVPDSFPADNRIGTLLVTVAVRNLALDSLELATDVVSVSHNYAGFLDVTVRNDGSIMETAEVKASSNGTIFEQRLLPVPAEQERLLSLDWDTTGLAPGVYFFTVQVMSLPGEDSSDNDAATGPVKLFQTLLHDVEVSILSKAGPSRVIIGSDVTVETSIRNNGPFDETFDASLFLGSTLLKTWSGLFIPTFGSLNLTFGWKTNMNMLGDYELKAVVTLLGDQISSNNEKGAMILSFVENSSPFPVYRIFPTAELIVGQEFRFDAGDSYDVDGSIVSYLWDFGDGTVAEGTVATHTYMKPGAVVLRLTVTDDLGKSMTVTDTITVVPVASLPSSNLPDASMQILAFLAALAVMGSGLLTVLRWRRQSAKRS